MQRSADFWGEGKLRGSSKCGQCPSPTSRFRSTNQRQFGWPHQNRAVLQTQTRLSVNSRFRCSHEAHHLRLPLFINTASSHGSRRRSPGGHTLCLLAAVPPEGSDQPDHVPAPVQVSVPPYRPTRRGRPTVANAMQGRRHCRHQGERCCPEGVSSQLPGSRSRKAPRVPREASARRQDV